MRPPVARAASPCVFSPMSLTGRRPCHDQARRRFAPARRAPSRTCRSDPDRPRDRAGGIRARPGGSADRSDPACVGRRSLGCRSVRGRRMSFSDSSAAIAAPSRVMPASAAASSSRPSRGCTGSDSSFRPTSVIFPFVSAVVAPSISSNCSAYAIARSSGGSYQPNFRGSLCPTRAARAPCASGRRAAPPAARTARATCPRSPTRAGRIARAACGPRGRRAGWRWRG